MKTKLGKLAWGIALMGAVVTTQAQSSFTITGTGSGDLNGVPFADNAFNWVLTYSTANPNINFGVNNPIYTLVSSQITLNGGSPINVTEGEGMWIQIAPSSIMAAPIRMSGGTAGGNILTVRDTQGWDGLSAFTSNVDPWSSFNQFTGIATDQGMLDMSTGTVGLFTISGVEAVPEPTTLALGGLGGLGVLWQLRRRK